MPSKCSQFSPNNEGSYSRLIGYYGDFEQCKRMCDHYNKKTPGDCVGFNMKISGSSRTGYKHDKRCYFISKKK